MGVILKNGVNYTGGGGSGTDDYSELTNKPQINGTTLIGNKTPEALGLVTKAVNDLVNYWLKTETYSKTEVDTIVTAIKNSRFEVVATLPTSDIKTNVIYLVPKVDAESGDIKDEYINLDGTTAGWERIGSTEIDLSGYVTTTALNTALANYTTTSDLTTLLAGKQDKVQYSVLPTASAELVGKIFEYTGVTGGGLTHGYFYECVSNGEDPATYSWVQTNVQPSGGGGTDYTAGDGIDITDDTISIDPMPAEDMDDVIDELPTGGNMAVAGYVPLGTLIPFYGETAPKFFLACDGSIYNKVDYPELANHLLSMTNNTPYIVDGDDTKFKVPDLRGEFIRGTGTNSHTNQGSGASVGVHQDGTKHIYTFEGGAKNVMYFRGTQDGSGYINATQRDSTYSNNQDKQVYIEGGYNVAELESGNSAFTSRPTNTSVLFCIAYKDIYSNPMNDYSTDEKVVGTWVDGKTLYQKTLQITMPTITTAGTVAYKNIDISSLNKDVCYVCGGHVIDSSNAYHLWGDFWIPSSGTSYNYFVRCLVQQSSITIGSNATALSNADGCITIQYTKTTD